MGGRCPESRQSSLGCGFVVLQPLIKMKASIMDTADKHGYADAYPLESAYSQDWKSCE